MSSNSKNGFHSEGLAILPSMPLEKATPQSQGQGQSSEGSACCCGSSAAPINSMNQYAIPGYVLSHFIEGFMQTDAGTVPLVSTTMNLRDKISTAVVRTGITRNNYRVSPGLYGVGTPDEHSEILVTANFKLTFDVLRRALKAVNTKDVNAKDVNTKDVNTKDVNAWILVLDTVGVNVWCAAGKGTFSTHELVRRIQSSGIEKVVKHRRVIVPQLGATGIRAEDVKKQSGFRVVYGPVRAEDIPAFLKNGRKADQAMRQVTFPFYERLILTPVELNGAFKPALITAVVLFLISGIGPGIFSFQGAAERGVLSLGFLLTGIFTGAVLTPALLPFIPFKGFAAKGLITGSVLSVYAIWASSASSVGFSGMLALFLFSTAVTSFLSMNFTGATPFTSPSGVEKEMKQFMPIQAGAVLLSAVLWIYSVF